MIYKDKTYRKDFPELFNWDICEKISICKLAKIIAKEIEAQGSMPIELRHNIAGLRRSLNIIAEQFETMG